MAGSVAMVLSGLVTDAAFNQFTYEGMMKAAQEKGIKTRLQRKSLMDEQLEVIRQFAQQAAMPSSSARAASSAMLWRTSLTRSSPTPSSSSPLVLTPMVKANMTAATIDYGHAGYLAGILAAMYHQDQQGRFHPGRVLC